MDAYQEYLARRRAAAEYKEYKRASARKEAASGPPARRVNWWAAYWLAWLVAALALLPATVAALAEPDGPSGLTAGDAVGIWAVAVLPGLAFLALGGMFILLELASPDPVPGAPTQSQLLARQNRLLEEQNRLLEGRRA
jgi:hypothetical protein